jgi:hypothetical protein
MDIDNTNPRFKKIFKFIYRQLFPIVLSSVVAGTSYSVVKNYNITINGKIKREVFPSEITKNENYNPLNNIPNSFAFKEYVDLNKNGSVEKNELIGLEREIFDYSEGGVFLGSVWNDLEGYEAAPVIYDEKGKFLKYLKRKEIKNDSPILTDIYFDFNDIDFKEGINKFIVQWWRTKETITDKENCEKDGKDMNYTWELSPSRTKLLQVLYKQGEDSNGEKTGCF